MHSHSTDIKNTAGRNAAAACRKALHGGTRHVAAASSRPQKVNLPTSVPFAFLNTAVCGSRYRMLCCTATRDPLCSATGSQDLSIMQVGTAKSTSPWRVLTCTLVVQWLLCCLSKCGCNTLVTGHLARPVHLISLQRMQLQCPWTAAAKHAQPASSTRLSMRSVPPAHPPAMLHLLSDDRGSDGCLSQPTPAP